MKKTIIFGTLFLTMLSCGSDEKKESKKPKASVVLPLIKAAKAEKTSFTHKISIQGNVESSQDILLNSEMSGMIKEVKIAAGDKVSM